MKQSPKKILVKSIEITRAEGISSLCGKKMTFDSWKKASSWLSSQSNTFPNNGCYDKHDFKVTFEDDKTYSGRLDCKHWNQSDNDLDVYQHILDFCQWNAGLALNPHCGIEKYKEMMQTKQYSESVGEYLQFIEKYL